MAGQTRRFLSTLGFATDGALDEEWTDERTEETFANVTPIGSHRRAERTRIEPVADAMHRIVTVRPRIFRDARTVGEAYREGIPVIMNLTEATDGDSRRLVDFASGLVLALHGKLERITPQVFLLSPATVEVTAENGDGRRNSYDGN
ncbi:MAG: cell division protein SepF [Bifidobacteriaceae bacterium]|jgi:cell division inhibitor SepF|nr:cell division protein SepF [Bifidobacteriaceae bacterium]